MESGATRIHIVNPMWSEVGGSEWRSYELARDLDQFGEVVFWSEGQVAPFWQARVRPRAPRLWHGDYPRDGVLLVVGVYFEIGRWLRVAQPRRTVLLYNTPDPARFRRCLKRLSLGGKRTVACAFASRWMADSAPIQGPVLPSPVDLDRFRPGTARRSGGSFRVGRMSRDLARKHHEADPELYKRLAADGFAVDLRGGTALASALAGIAGVTLRPCAAEGSDDFLRSLDAFFYRTSTGYREPHGRVVTEAMACALPVVCDRRGGWVDFVRDGENGFLFDDEREAIAILRRLRDEPALRRRVGRRARDTVAALFSSARRREWARWIAHGEPPGVSARAGAAATGASVETAAGTLEASPAFQGSDRP